MRLNANEIFESTLWFVATELWRENVALFCNFSLTNRQPQTLEASVFTAITKDYNQLKSSVCWLVLLSQTPSALMPVIASETKSHFFFLLWLILYAVRYLHTVDTRHIQSPAAISNSSCLTALHHMHATCVCVCISVQNCVYSCSCRCRHMFSIHSPLIHDKSTNSRFTFLCGKILLTFTYINSH